MHSLRLLPATSVGGGGVPEEDDWAWSWPASGRARPNNAAPRRENERMIRPLTDFFPGQQDTTAPGPRARTLPPERAGNAARPGRRAGCGGNAETGRAPPARPPCRREGARPAAGHYVTRTLTLASPAVTVYHWPEGVG